MHCLEYRKIIKIYGTDATKFLQNILSNDINNVGDHNLQYNLLLTPQGKVLYDFFIFKISGDFYLDCHAESSENIKNKFEGYRLHSDITIEDTEFNVFISSQSNLLPYSYLDPRSHSLCYRYYHAGCLIHSNTHAQKKIFEIDEQQRLKQLIPEFGIDFMSEKFYPLDLGLDKSQGISFNKGCYVGQEITARMHYRAKRNKHLEYVNFNHYDIVNNDVLVGKKKIGVVLKNYDTQALLLLRTE